MFVHHKKIALRKEKQRMPCFAAYAVFLLFYTTCSENFMLDLDRKAYCFVSFI